MYLLLFTITVIPVDGADYGEGEGIKKSVCVLIKRRWSFSRYRRHTT